MNDFICLYVVEFKQVYEVIVFTVNKQMFKSYIVVAEPLKWLT